jgi:hypothetical protein
MITNLAGMMFERLNLFKTRNKLLPNRILVYRDGVSEVGVMVITFYATPTPLNLSPRDNSRLWSQKNFQRLGPPLGNSTGSVLIDRN